MKKNVCVLLEFGIPPYRDFLFKYLASVSNDFLVIHNGQLFDHVTESYKSIKVRSFNLYKFTFYRNVNSRVKPYEVVISSFNFWRPSCWIPLFLYKNKRTIIWGHIQGSHDNFVAKAFKRICIKRADSVLSYTEKGKKYAVEHLRADPEKIRVVRNTLYVSNATDSKEARIYFLYVGRVQKRKDLETFIVSIKDIKWDGELFRIVGEGEHKEELMRLVDKLGVADKVKFYPGTFDDEELKSHFENALAYVSPNQLGLGVVHAFAYGIPVLADGDEAHGPEFEYCNDENSFIYHGTEELQPIIKKILADSNLSFKKGGTAFDFFNANLNVYNMQNAFFKAIYN